MLGQDRIQPAARWLWAAHHDRQAFAPIPAPWAPRTVDEAYAMQAALQSLLTEVHGPIAGYKIALTTPVMQQMVGFHAPIAGVILARTIHVSPVTIHRTDYLRLGVECEIAVQLGRDLPAAQAPYRRDQIDAAVGAIIPAFELVDDRQADYTQLTAHVLTLIADNAWNAGIVLGAPRQDWRHVDLAASRAEMRLNGIVVGDGYGRDIMGHPMQALLWLVNMLAQQGKSLSKGMIVMTGSLVTTRFVDAGDIVGLSLHGIGEVQLSVA